MGLNRVLYEFISLNKLMILLSVGIIFCCISEVYVVQHVLISFGILGAYKMDFCSSVNAKYQEVRRMMDCSL